MQFLKAIAVLIGGMVCLAVGDAAAMLAASMTEEALVVNLAELVISGAIGILAGRVLGHGWYLAAMVPLLYFGYMTFRLGETRMLWINLQMPLAVITSLAGAFLGASNMHK